MKFFDRFTRRATRSEEVRFDAHDDHKLILTVTAPTRIPRGRQLRYFLRIMTPAERRLFVGAFAFAVLALVGTAALFVRSHLDTRPAVGGTFTEAVVGTPEHLNPLDAPGHDVDQDLTRLIYSGLFRWNGLDAVPDLAESAEWSADRKTLTIRLRRGATFHDGEPVTVEDVRFTIDSAKDPSRKSALASAFRNVAVDVKDDATVSFTLDRPDPALPGKLTVGILPAHVWQDIPAATARLSDANLKPVGSGPYRVKSFLRDSNGVIRSYTLERFDAAEPAPFLKTIVFQFLPDRREAADALKTGLVDAVAFADPATVGSGDVARIKDVKLDLPQETIAFFNLRHPILSNANVRAALVLAVNRDDLPDVDHRRSEPVFGPFPFLAATTSASDLDRARKLLDDAGWVLPEGGSVRVYKAPTKKTKAPPAKTTKTAAAKPTATDTPTASSTELAFSILVPEGSDLVPLAEALQRAWSLLAARVAVETLPTEEVMRRATRDRTDAVVVLNILLGPDQDILPFWWSSQATDRGLNISNVRDRNVDDALNLLHAATTTAALEDARRVVTRALQPLTPAIFLRRPLANYFVSSKIRGLPDRLVCATSAERFQAIESWYRRTGWTWK